MKRSLSGNGYKNATAQPQFSFLKLTIKCDAVVILYANDHTHSDRYFQGYTFGNIIAVEVFIFLPFCGF